MKNDSVDFKKLGKKIQYYRKKKGITQQQLAELTEIAPSNISNVERAVNSVSLPSLVKIAKVLDVTLDQLLSINSSQAKLILRDDIANVINNFDQNELDSILEVIIAFKKAINK